MGTGTTGNERRGASPPFTSGGMFGTLLPMKNKLMILLAAGLVLAGCVEEADKQPASSNTTYARDAIQKYIDSGELPGAISILYKDGVQETACLGYSDVAKKRPIRLNDAFADDAFVAGHMPPPLASAIHGPLR